MNVNLLYNCDVKYYRFIRDNYGKEPSVIIMHPKTRDYLIMELQKQMHVPNIVSFDYRGVKVIRSKDIQEGYFEVY